MDKLSLSVVPLALELQNIFENKKRMDKGYYRCPPNFFEIFKKAAEICKAFELDPSVYIEAQFYWFGFQKMEVHPNMMAHKKAYEAYLQYVESSYISPEKIIEVCKGYIENHVIKLKRSLETILLDDDIDLPPWFRIVASAEAIPSVIEKYLIQARTEATPEVKKALEKEGFDIKRIWNLEKNS